MEAVECEAQIKENTDRVVEKEFKTQRMKFPSTRRRGSFVMKEKEGS